METGIARIKAWFKNAEAAAARHLLEETDLQAQVAAATVEVAAKKKTKAEAEAERKQAAIDNALTFRISNVVGGPPDREGKPVTPQVEEDGRVALTKLQDVMSNLKDYRMKMRAYWRALEVWRRKREADPDTQEPEPSFPRGPLAPPAAPGVPRSDRRRVRSLRSTSRARELSWSVGRTRAASHSTQTGRCAKRRTGTCTCLFARTRSCAVWAGKKPTGSPRRLTAPGRSKTRRARQRLKLQKHVSSATAESNRRRRSSRKRRRRRSRSRPHPPTHGGAGGAPEGGRGGRRRGRRGRHVDARGARRGARKDAGRQRRSSRGASRRGEGGHRLPQGARRALPAYDDGVYHVHARRAKRARPRRAAPVRVAEVADAVRGATPGALPVLRVGRANGTAEAQVARQLPARGAARAAAGCRTGSVASAEDRDACARPRGGAGARANARAPQPDRQARVPLPRPLGRHVWDSARHDEHGDGVPGDFEEFKRHCTEIGDAPGADDAGREAYVLASAALVELDPESPAYEAEAKRLQLSPAAMAEFQKLLAVAERVRRAWREAEPARRPRRCPGRCDRRSVAL